MILKKKKSISTQAIDLLQCLVTALWDMNQLLNTKYQKYSIKKCFIVILNQTFIFRNNKPNFFQGTILHQFQSIDQAGNPRIRLSQSVDFTEH